MPAIVGWHHLPFLKASGGDLEAMIAEAAKGALAHAGIEAAAVDEVFLGHFNEGFVAQGFTAPLVTACDPALRFKPATRLENACATGSAAVFAGLRAIRGGDARVVLVVGAERMSELSGAAVGDALLRASYVKNEAATPGGFAGVFGRIAELYFQRYGDQSDALAAIAAKNHANGVENAYAQMRKDLGFDFCRSVSDKNPYVAGPLKRTDCSLVSDGAAALVIVDDAMVHDFPRAVGFRATAQVGDVMPMAERDVVRFEGCGLAWRQALEKAGVGLDDLDLVETHDCFTIAELIEYEAMGLAPPGKGANVALDGTTRKSGRLPVNPSGGLKAKGHPIGATGVSMHALCAMQLTDAANGMQVPGAALAGLYNMGGACVASYVSILERTR